jgi:hypothetical protein
MNAPEKIIAEVPWANPIEVEITFKRKRILHPERVVIDCGIDKGRQIKYPLGVLCYEHRRYVGKWGKVGTWFVNPKSLSVERRPVVLKFVNWLCEKHYGSSVFTKQSYARQFRWLFDWIDEHYLAGTSNTIEFDNQDSLKAMYIALTRHLKERIKIGQTGQAKTAHKGLGNKHANAQQYLARQVIGLCLNVDEETIKSWTSEIRVKAASKYRLISSESNEAIALFHDRCVAAIEAHHQIYVKNEQDVVAGEDWGWVMRNQSNYNKGLGSNWVTSESQHNSFVLVAFYFMVLATGQNESVLLGLKVDEVYLNRLNQSTYRLGVKARARGKEIVVEMGDRHKHIFEKYLQVRAKIAPPGNDYLFPDCVAGSLKAVGTTRPWNASWKKALGGEIFRAQALRRFHSRKMGQVAQDMHVASGNVNAIVATMLQNKPLTACQYPIESPEQSASPLSEFLGDLHDACIKKSRNQATIPVHRVKHIEADKSTPTGACNRSQGQEPHLAQGFTEHAPQLRCGVWESCLFCEYYGVHADQTDVKRLLSLKAVIELLHQGMDEGEYANRFAALLNRITEVITAMTQMSPSLKTLVPKIEKDCQTGDLDEFWAGYMRTLKLSGYQKGGAL